MHKTSQTTWRLPINYWLGISNVKNCWCLFDLFDEGWCLAGAVRRRIQELVLLNAKISSLRQASGCRNRNVPPIFAKFHLPQTVESRKRRRLIELIFRMFYFRPISCGSTRIRSVYSKMWLLLPGDLSTRAEQERCFSRASLTLIASKTISGISVKLVWFVVKSARWWACRTSSGLETCYQISHRESMSATLKWALYSTKAFGEFTKWGKSSVSPQQSNLVKHLVTWRCLLSKRSSDNLCFPVLTWGSSLQ